VFLEEVARRLARRGRPVTVFCAAHAAAPSDERVDGVRFIRRGSWRTVYAWGALYHLMGRFGPHEVMVDVQNGVPFLSPLYCRRPVVALVHHVHKEQWEMLFGGRSARLGWWVESRLGPAVYRRSSYVAVSEATRTDLAHLGIDAGRITVVHNGSERYPAIALPKAGRPTITYLGRLVPHKRIELLFEAAAVLRPVVEGLQVRVVGRGLWEPRLRRRVAELGLEETVRFDGFVDEDRRRRILAASWVLALPSVREGWGLAVMEAAAAGTPAVAFETGGLAESIRHGETGLLAEDLDGFIEALHAILSSAPLRDRLGTAARAWSARFSWEATAEAFDAALRHAVRPATVERSLPVPSVGEVEVVLNEP
jgi:glycosyltransferase involved in cell wall biosynthesis